MKILHITTFDNGGAGLCCLRIHQSLLDMGIESKIVTLKNTQHFREEYEYGFLIDKISKALSKFFRFFNLEITERNKIIRLKETHHSAYTLPVSNIDLSKQKWIKWADVIHLHWVNDYLDYPSFFKKVKKPIVWTLHDENLFYGIAHINKTRLLENTLEIKYKEIKYKSLLQNDNLTIVFLSTMMLNKFGNEEIVRNRKKFVVNNSVNPSVFKILDQRKMREKYGLSFDTVYFVFISKNIADPNKGLNVLSDVLLCIDPTYEILAIGGNPWNQCWKNVKQLGVIDDQSKMCELISCANYMAMPSFQEAFSQSPLEAMACGLPVVAFPVSGTEELINRFNGVVCRDFSSSSLKEAIIMMLNTNYCHETIREDVINRFSPNVIASQYISIYEKLLHD